MKISQKGLYAIRALMVLARHQHQGAMRVRDIAGEESLPEKFLELILLDLKNARLVQSLRGAKGGYRLRRDPAQVRLSNIIRTIDGSLAPFADAEQLHELIEQDPNRRALYQVLLDVRNAAVGILDHTSLADLISDHARQTPRLGLKRKQEVRANLLPVTVEASSE